MNPYLYPILLGFTSRLLKIESVNDSNRRRLLIN